MLINSRTSSCTALVSDQYQTKTLLCRYDPDYGYDEFGEQEGRDSGYSTHGQEFPYDSCPPLPVTGTPNTPAGGQQGQHSEQQAIVAIEKAYSKPVAFSVRTNVMYDGTLDDDSPVHGCAVRSVLSAI